MNFILSHFKLQGILFTQVNSEELASLYKKQFDQLKTYLGQLEKETNKSGEIIKLQQLSLILVFIAHATISDGTKAIQKK